MSDAIALHNALRDVGYLPPAVDLKFSQCPMKHVELMEALEEELGIGSTPRVKELEVALEDLESKLEALEVEYRRVCAENVKLKKGAA